MKISYGAAVFLTLTVSLPSWVLPAKAEKLSDKLLSSDPAVRQQAVQDFNRLPADVQFTMVPDFMVAMSDEDPAKRRIAQRILKALGVKTSDQAPDVKKTLSEEKKIVPVVDKQSTLTEIKKEKEDRRAPDAMKALGETKPAKEALTQDAALQELQKEKRGSFDDMRAELDKEKRDHVTLDPSEFRSGSDAASPMAILLDSLKDPEPWVRARAARRLSMIHPAPVETIPTLIEMVADKDTDARKAAVAALGSFGPLASGAVPALKKALADPDADVRQIAIESLRQIQGPQ